uniref:Reverse transcriptase domain-containing protein n=1 Tax=Triticum urartu TaxID=4572 RepID=A0A8R7P891_TRIUA
MLVQGMARRLNALRNPTVLLKLDISKAFDSVQWPFLIEVLHIMGFGTRWIGWICGLLATSSTRIMLNGVPGKPIYNQCGLRQGNPLSPMLFILIMEPLQRLFHAASESGLLAPLAANGLRNRLSIFADDAIIFLKPHLTDLTTCTTILDMFATASGLHTNLTKSAALPIRCTQEQMAEVTSVLGCSLGGFPMRYLGLPLTIRKQSAAQLQGLVDHIAACLPTWRA